MAKLSNKEWDARFPNWKKVTLEDLDKCAEEHKEIASLQYFSSKRLYDLGVYKFYNVKWAFWNSYHPTYKRVKRAQVTTPASNRVYLIKDEKRDVCLFKVGFTSDVNKRSTNYITHNPNAEFINAVETYGVTKRDLETRIHREIAQKGLQYVKTEKAHSEWFIVDYDSPLYSALCSDGLAVFDACKGRKILTE